MNYETFNNMSMTEKDHLCDGIELHQKIQQHNEKEKKRESSSSLKRHPTNHSQINYDGNTEECVNDEEDFQVINYTRYRKKRFTSNKDERIQGRTILNSNINNNKNLHTTTLNINKMNDESLRISKHALDYASEYRFQPNKIECEPKIKDQREGSKFIQTFLNYIKEDFLKQNVLYNKPLLFDLWWIDGEGDIQAVRKSAEIIVYLPQTNRYPKELNNIKITPHPPKHLLLNTQQFLNG